MKILPVSFSFNSKNASANLEHQFFYTVREFKPVRKNIENFNLFAGMLALIAVGITLFNIGKAGIPLKKVFVV